MLLSDPRSPQEDYALRVKIDATGLSWLYLCWKKKILRHRFSFNHKFLLREMCILELSSVQFSRSVVSNSLRPHESQHARPPCSSPSPGVHSDSHPSSQWCYPAISSSVVPFSSCPQSLPASVFYNESTLHMRWPKYWSFSFSIIPSKEIPGLISKCKV